MLQIPVIAVCAEESLIVNVAGVNDSEIKHSIVEVKATVNGRETTTITCGSCMLLVKIARNPPFRPPATTTTTIPHGWTLGAAYAPRRGDVPPPLRVAPDDLIKEIFLRLPQHPAYIHRISLVCKHWRCLVHDRVFLHRLRAHHDHTAPVIGFFGEDASFVPAGEPPDRVTVAQFCLHRENWRVLCCRRRVLLGSTYRRRAHGHSTWLQLIVWDPTGRSRMNIFPGSPHPQIPYGRIALPIHGSLICGVGARDHDSHDEDCASRPFRVVILFYCAGSMVAGVYSSEASSWSDLVSMDIRRHLFDSVQPGVLVGISVLAVTSREQDRLHMSSRPTSYISL
ncbi:hypothetical protein QOZ80_2BG0173180 [Eleusine coracana subsp. coracana]|nr:hypothetical protein QOZ80_2BG0173180 [Eleusine coracana subsp. coracana]